MTNPTVTANIDELAVCRVTEQGEVVCERERPRSDSDFDDVINALRPVLQGIQIGTEPQPIPANRIELILAFVRRVLESELSNAEIGNRTTEIVDASEHMLGTELPTMLLVKRLGLSGDVMAAFYLNRARYVEMHRVLQRWP